MKQEASGQIILPSPSRVVSVAGSICSKEVGALLAFDLIWRWSRHLDFDVFGMKKNLGTQEKKNRLW